VIGVADKIAVGKEQKLDDIPAQTGWARAGSDRRYGLGPPRRKIYVSLIDIS
jgi:hypothetical protein